MLLLPFGSLPEVIALSEFYCPWWFLLIQKFELTLLCVNFFVLNTVGAKLGKFWSQSYKQNSVLKSLNYVTSLEKNWVFARMF